MNTITVLVCLATIVAMTPVMAVDSLPLQAFSDVGRNIKATVDKEGIEESLRKLTVRMPSDTEPVKMTKEAAASISKHLKAKMVTSVFNSSTSFTCESVPTTYSPYLFCSGVVDYPFLVPEGTDSTAMDTEARQQASLFNPFINSPCLSDAKRLICANIYLPCLPTAQSGDLSTYQVVDNEPLPYLKPCSSLCTATTSSGTTCAGLLEGLGLAPTCTSAYGYDSTSTPWSAANPADVSQSYPVCNDMASTNGVQLVASPSEPYIGTTCAGIVTDYYVINFVDPTMAPMLPPYVMQTVMEAAITTYAGFMPKYASSACQTSFREAFCTTLMLNAYPVNDLSFMFGTVYIPSFPEYGICTNYMEECAAILLIAPAFALDCNGTVAGATYRSYPTQPQTIVSLDLGFTVVNLQSPPFEVDQSTVVPVVPQCPYGTAIPEDPTKPPTQMIWIGEFACALSCPSPMYTADEYDHIYTNYHVAHWVCVIFCVMQLINIYALKPAKRNKFILLGVLLVFGEFFILLVQRQNAKHSRDMVCGTNTSWYSKDDFYESQGSVGCVVSAYTYTLIGYLTSWYMVPLSTEVWLRVVRGVKDVKPLEKYYLWPSLAITLMFYLLGANYGDPVVDGPGGAQFDCQLVHGDRYIAYYVTTLPFTLNFAVALVLSIHSMYVLCVVSMRVKDADKSAFAKIWKSYSMIILILVLFLMIYPMIIFYFMTKAGFVDTPMYIQGVNDWLTCLFVNFQSSDDLTYIATCGESPAVRPSVGLQLYGICLVYPMSVMFFWITLNGDAKSLWYNIFITVLQKTYLLPLLKMCSSSNAVHDIKVVDRKIMSSASESSSEDSIYGKPKEQVDMRWHAQLSRMLLGRFSEYDVNHQRKEKRDTMRKINVTEKKPASQTTTRMVDDIEKNAAAGATGDGGYQMHAGTIALPQVEEDATPPLEGEVELFQLEEVDEN